MVNQPIIPKEVRISREALECIAIKDALVFAFIYWAEEGNFNNKYKITYKKLKVYLETLKEEFNKWEVPKE